MTVYAIIESYILYQRKVKWQRYIIYIVYKLSIVNIYDIIDRLVINEDNILIDIKV